MQQGELVLYQEAQEILDWITDKRRTIHKTPELAYKEFETSTFIQNTLASLDIPFDAPIAETGVVGYIGTGKQPCVALRADMDALPIKEETDLPFKSEVDGKMHACGHDSHIAMLLGAARLLKAREREIEGTVKLIFQPAEEGGAGAQRMIDEGVLERPEVSRIFGLHVWPAVPSGNIGGTEGPFLAAAGQVEITITGVGGHAAMPHQTKDPIVCASKLVVELQTLVSRERDPLSPTVVSIANIHGGGRANNVIPPKVKLGGTIRCFDLEEMKHLQERIRSISLHIAEANLCTAEVQFPGHDYPPTVNDPHSFALVCEISRNLSRRESVEILQPVMGGEDFAYFLQEVPGCIVGLGIKNEELGSTYNLHSPKFLVDEGALPMGSALHAGFALRSIAELRK